jgi:predicted glycosyltransferase involved in capsule biosynthesis
MGRVFTSMWREDFFAVNGFDESFEGWGHEDADLAIRLIRNDVLRKDGQFALPVLHLWHKESDRGSLAQNNKLLDEVASSNRVNAIQGINKHIVRQ